MKRFQWLAAFVALSTGAALCAVEPPTADPHSKPPDYMVIVTGGELLRGVYQDGHTFFLTRTLRPLGCRCVGSMSVDDKPEDLKAALGFASARASLVIVTGGLGPTHDDITRQTLAEFTGIPLQEHPDVLSEMARRFNQPADQLRPNLRRQTLVPTRGAYFKNPHGTAIGLVFDLGGRLIVALPGPPRELQPMVTAELIPLLTRRFGLHAPGCSLTLRFVGIGQSQLDQTLYDRVPLPSDLLISSLFEAGRVDVTFTLPHDTAADRARLSTLKTNVLQHLGDFVYAEDGSTLEEQVVKRFRQHGGSLVLAEVGSGGHLATSLAGVDGAATLLAGAYVAPTEDALCRLLQVPASEAARQSDGDRAKVLAMAAACLTQSDWVIAVGQIERDGAGVDRVWVAWKLTGRALETQRLRVRGTGETAGSNLTTEILDRVRRQLK